MKEFQLDIKKALEMLGTNLETGLNDEKIRLSVEKNGINEFTKGESKSFIKRVLEAFKEPMTIMLFVAGFITVAVNAVTYFKTGHAEFVESIGIFVAILIAVSITVLMEGRSAKAFEALNKIKEDINVEVLRSSKVILIPQNKIVVGDILYIETGDKIPADGRLIDTSYLSVDESSLTGESEPVEKDANVILESEKTSLAERVNMIYSGSFVAGGSGTVLVTSVGDSTEIGNIARELSASEDKLTPLQEKLAKMGKIIAILGSSLALIVFLVQIIQFAMRGIMTFENIAEAFITSIVLIVAAVPEGLPTIVAVSLALNIIKMSKQNALVKKLVACETIGSINVICSDKTGTLTENRMTVIDVFVNGNIISPSSIPDGYLKENFCINSTANVEFDGKNANFIGNPTECALLVAFGKSFKDESYLTIRKQAHIVHSYPFSSENKNMTTIIKKDVRFIAFSKGSPEKILAQCDKILINGKVSVLTSEHISDIEQKIIEFQQKSCRVIGFAHKEYVDEVDFESQRDTIESEMVYTGFVAIMDPLRADVYDAIENCRNAGIDIKILTGDNIVTAKAIASELGVLDDEHIAVIAKDLDDLSDDEFLKIIPKIRVIARSTPTIKMRVVNALKKLGNVVAVTGDGINDAPAIKHADVGIAMGISGTEVSKEASDIILLDDSFTTIVKAVHWGRGIYENFQRFIQFQLTVNLSSVVVVLASIFIGLKSPFTALQLLWVNIIMDGPPALTLGLEPIGEDLMKRKPTTRNSSIITKNMLSNIIFSGVYITTVFLIQTKTNFIGGSDAEKSTILFVMFVLFQLFNAFNSRTLNNDSIFKKLVSNQLMLLVFAITFCLQIAITQFGGAVFKTVPLSLIMWLKLIGVSFTIIIAVEIYNFIRRIINKHKTTA